MSKIQLRLDFAPSVKSKNISCQKCDMPINLIAQKDLEIKSCPHCGDRTWLLNLKTAEACVLYAINPLSLGGRLRDD